MENYWKNARQSQESQFTIRLIYYTKTASISTPNTRKMSHEVTSICMKLNQKHLFTVCIDGSDPDSNY